MYCQVCHFENWLTTQHFAKLEARVEWLADRFPGHEVFVNIFLHIVRGSCDFVRNS